MWDKTLKPILDKHGPWAFFAVLFVAMYVVFHMQPASNERKQMAEERAKLMDAVTRSLERNSDAMDRMAVSQEAMSRAVVRLDHTLSRLEDLQAETKDHLKEFTRGVNDCHDAQTDLLRKIHGGS